MLENFWLDIDRLLNYFEACKVSASLCLCSHKGEPCEVNGAEVTNAAEIEGAISKESKYLAERLSEVRMQEELCEDVALANSETVAVNRFDWKMLPRPTIMYPNTTTRRCPYGGGGAMEDRPKDLKKKVRRGLGLILHHN